MMNDRDRLRGASVTALGRDGDGQIYLDVRARLGGRVETRTISWNSFATSPDRSMAALGLVTTDARRTFRATAEKAVQSMRPSFRVASRPGPHGSAFVLPNGRVVGGDGALRVCLPPAVDDVAADWSEAGSLSGWKAIAQLAIGNSRMMLGLALPFAGPVVALLTDLELPMIQLVGERGAGKSTIACAAASVYGRPVPRTWSQTVNQMEVLAAARSGTVLALDELGTFDLSKKGDYIVFRTAVMRLFEGQEKGRMNEIAGSWRLAILSTSNRSIDEMARAVGILVDDPLQEALRSRIVDVPMPESGQGAYEDLHGHATIASFVGRIKRGLIDHHGGTGRVFVQRMLRWQAGQDDRGVAWLRARRLVYVAAARRRFPGAAGRDDYARPHEIFGTTYAGARLAIKLGLLPWSVADLERALLACEAAHIALVAATAPARRHCAATTTPLEALRRHVTKNAGSLVDLRNGLIDPSSDHDHRACPGYINRHLSGTVELLFSDSTLLRVCGTEARLNRLKKDLQDRRHLRRGAARPSVKRSILKDRGPDERKQVIAVNADAFGVT